jgi:hypothetical protein
VEGPLEHPPGALAGQLFKDLADLDLAARDERVGRVQGRLVGARIGRRADDLDGLGEMVRFSHGVSFWGFNNIGRVRRFFVPSTSTASSTGRSTSTETVSAVSTQPEASSTPIGGRRYTPRMGAVETMEDFFEKLNGGDREAAVALMDEKTEMRVHVGDSVQTLRGVERVGGWFLRGEKGLKMIPGEIRDTGNTFETDLLVVRPGAQSQHIDATFRVEAGKITAINIAPR